MKPQDLTSTLKQLAETIERLELALHHFDQKGLTPEESEIFFDAVTKRFEVAFEQAWKGLQAVAIHEGSDVAGPRPAIQEAVRYGWIDDPEYWALALETRNGSVHDYFSVNEPEFIEIIRAFIPQSRALVKKLQNVK